MINKANYYAVIPATILFDKDLSPIEKILFAHISVLSEKDWYCFASNWYLWEQIGRTPCNVSKILSKIQKKWYISIFQDGTKRLIYLEIGVVKNDKGGCQKWQGGVVKNDKHNIEDINIKNYYLWKNQKIEETKKYINSDIQTFEEFIQSLNFSKISLDFFYKVGTQTSFHDFAMNFWLYCQEKWKKLNVKNAEIAFRRFLKPTWETEEDRKAMIADFEQKKQKTALSKISENEKIKQEKEIKQSEEKRKTVLQNFESFLNDEGKKVFFQEAEKWLLDNIPNFVLIGNKKPLIINKALNLFESTDKSQIDFKYRQSILTWNK